jgi:hypothetical protein
MQAHRLLFRAGICASLALAFGAQAQVARVAPGTPSPAKTVNTQAAAAFGLPRAAGLSSPNPNSLTAGSTAVNIGSSATTAPGPSTGIGTGTTGAGTTGGGGGGTTVGTGTTDPGTGGSTDGSAGNGTGTGTGTVVGSGAVTTGGFGATAVMGAGAGTNLPAPRQGASMGPGPYTGVEVAGSFLTADANGDRELSRADATRLSIMTFAFEEMDANHDGVVTRSEYETSFGR